MKALPGKLGMKEKKMLVDLFLFKKQRQQENMVMFMEMRASAVPNSSNSCSITKGTFSILFLFLLFILTLFIL